MRPSRGQMLRRRYCNSTMKVQTSHLCLFSFPEIFSPRMKVFIYTQRAAHFSSANHLQLFCFPFTSTHFHHLLLLCLHRSCATSSAGASLIYQLSHLFSCHLLPRALIAVAALPALPTHDLIGSKLLLVTMNSHSILILSPTRL